MKKAIVPLCILLFVFAFIIVFCCVIKKREYRVSLKTPQPNTVVGINDDTGMSDGTVTIIGSPDTTDVDMAFVEYNSYIEIPQITALLPEQILHRKGYTASYNIRLRIPNWVAWHLTADHAEGDVKRPNNYLEDEEVLVPRATNDDYHKSGWSRGHMCPAGDNKWDEQAMNESFLLTNVCPQDRGLNSGVWNRIEIDCRRWAKKYGDVYIVCGPVLLNREHETIGTNMVVVPEAFFKVILCLQGTPKAIGYVIRNNEGKKKRDMFINTVDEVERITGYDFFPALPDSIEDEVEASADISVW